MTKQIDRSKATETKEALRFKIKICKNSKTEKKQKQMPYETMQI